MAADAGRAIRRVRGYLKGMTDDLTAELGPEFRDVDLRSLNPRTFVAKHLLEDLDDEPPAATGSRSRTAGSAEPAAGASVRTRAQPDAPLGKDEPAPWDPDTT
jgi:sec-independent protein translocase protein TatB